MAADGWWLNCCLSTKTGTFCPAVWHAALWRRSLHSGLSQAMAPDRSTVFCSLLQEDFESFYGKKKRKDKSFYSSGEEDEEESEEEGSSEFYSEEDDGKSVYRYTCIMNVTYYVRMLFNIHLNIRINFLHLLSVQKGVRKRKERVKKEARMRRRRVRRRRKERKSLLTMLKTF